MSSRRNTEVATSRYRSEIFSKRRVKFMVGFLPPQAWVSPGVFLSLLSPPQAPFSLVPSTSSRAAQHLLLARTKIHIYWATGSHHGSGRDFCKMWHSSGVCVTWFSGCPGEAALHLSSTELGETSSPIRLRASP